jgi:hypothetical protein
VQLAEREGFEPSIPLRVCRISSAVRSTTPPPLRSRPHRPTGGRARPRGVVKRPAREGRCPSKSRDG